MVNAYTLSGYPQAARDVLIDEAWEKGLEPETQWHVRRTITLMQAQKLEAAENTWRDIQQAADIDYNPFESIAEYEETPRRKVLTKILQRTPARTTARTPEP